MGSIHERAFIVTNDDPRICGDGSISPGRFHENISSGHVYESITVSSRGLEVLDLSVVIAHAVSRDRVILVDNQATERPVDRRKLAIESLECERNSTW